MVRADRGTTLGSEGRGLWFKPPGLSSTWGILAAPQLPDTPVSEPPNPRPERRSLFERLVEFISHGPDSKDELIRTLAEAESRELIEPESRLMLEGVLRMADLTAGDVMVAAPRMDLLDIDWPYERLLGVVIETAHSRFPVHEGERDNIIGILLAKDLLRYYAGQEFELRDMLRPAVFVPESKRLNVLLRDFRSNHNHLALVVDEYGGVCGMVTIEDVLEQIVGDIADEFDFDEDEDNIIRKDDSHWRVKADTEIADFNAEFGSDFSDEEYDTIGGLILKTAGQLPRRGEQFQVGAWKFTVQRADSRRLYSLLVERTLPDQTQA